MNGIVYFILFAVFGVAHEVFWTGILDSIKTKNKRLKGRSSLWMFPIYGCIFFIILFVQTYFSDYSWWFRGFLYMFLIYSWEYLSGFILKSTIGVAPWEYSSSTKDGVGSKKRFQLHGLICLEYAPIWFVEGLIAEWFYLVLQSAL